MAYDPARDPLYGMAASLSSPTRHLRLVEPSDTVDLDPYAKALWVFVPTGMANAVVRLTPVGAADDSFIDVQALPGLQPLPPCQARRVWLTGTTAGLAVYALSDR